MSEIEAKLETIKALILDIVQRSGTSQDSSIRLVALLSRNIYIDNRLKKSIEENGRFDLLRQYSGKIEYMGITPWFIRKLRVENEKCIDTFVIYESNILNRFLLKNVPKGFISVLTITGMFKILTPSFTLSGKINDMIGKNKGN